MTPEERFERIERQIEFIVNQQAQFSVDLEKSREELREREAVLQKQIDGHEKQINALNSAAVALITTTHQLAEAQAETQAELKELAATTKEAVQKLEEKSAETQERLHILIDTFERYLSERRNGNAGNGGAETS